MSKTCSNTKKFEHIYVPASNYIMIDGQGSSKTSLAYINSLQAIYSTVHAIKANSKNNLNKNYVVAPLEILRWTENSSQLTLEAESKWTLMIMQPEWVNINLCKETIETLSTEEPATLLPKVYFQTLLEGDCLQIKHIGSYEEQAPILKQLHNIIMPYAGLTFNGRHHEIYLNDITKTKTEKLETILRQPVRPI